MVISLLKRFTGSAEFKNISWLISDRIWRMAISLIVGIWVVRYLGPDNYGFINYVLAYIGIGTVVSNMGMESFLVKEITVHPNQRQHIIFSGFLLRVIASVLVLISLLLILYFTNEPAGVFLMLALVVPQLLSSPFAIVDLAFQADLKSRVTVVHRNVCFVLVSILKIVAIFTNQNVYVFGLLTAMDIVIADILLFYYYKRRYSGLFSLTPDIGYIKALASKAIPFLLSNVAIVIYMKVDQVLLGKLSLKSEVGYFAAATKVAEIFYFIPLVVTGSLFRLLSTAKKDSLEKYIKTVRQIFYYLLLGATAISLLIFAFSVPIVSFLFGSEFLPAVPVLQVYIWSLIFIFIGVAFNQLLVMEDLSRMILYKTLAGLILNILLNLILIPKYGALGSAVATLFTQFVSTVASNWWLPKANKVFGYYFRKA